MKCPSCQHENLFNAKFCQECGARLVSACTNCGSVLPETAKFCPQCAHPVNAPAPQAGEAAPSAQTVTPAGERRQATVLFADISGYTELCARLDGEQVQAMLNRFYAITDRIVAAYGGSVIDHAGDGVLAVFGAPVAHGNDPERAVRAALEMHAEASRLSAPDARPLALHIGVASGEVVAAVLSGGATPKYTITGDTVNLAARLDALAGAGDTLLSQAVYLSVSSSIDTIDLGEKSVKGFAAPVRVHRVRGLRQGPADRLPFVGRQSELRQLIGALETTSESGTGVAVAVRGDPGIGKSRLMEELHWRAQAKGFACHIGRVLDFGVAKGEDALPAVVSAMLGIAPGSAEANKRAGLMAAIDSGLLAAQHEALLADVLGLTQREELHAIFDAMDNVARMKRTAQAVAELAVNVARSQPRLLMFEDIHWGTPLLLDCLAALGMAARTGPLMLAMTTRFEGDPLEGRWRAATHGTPLLTIDVGPLRAEEARDLAGGVVDSSNRFALECIERAEGNPLFLEQLLRNARESGSANIPPTVQSLVLARMDRLPPLEKQALQAASVLGKRFVLEALRQLLRNRSYHCDALVAADLVRPDSADTYLFAHALIQEGVYSSLLNSRKRELHADAAQWYGEHEPTLRAEHLDRAQHPDAAAAYLSAAQSELASFRYDVAFGLAERGTELVGDGELRCELALLRGEVLREMARTHDAMVAFEQALQVAVNDQQRCRAWMGIATGHRITGAFDPAMEALSQALPIALREQQWAACSYIHNTYGNLQFAQGQADACGAEHQRALDYARQAGSVEREALALSGLGDYGYARGHMVTALGHFRRCIELCRQAGLVRIEIPNLCMAGHCLSWTGNVAEGLEVIHSAAELSKRIGLVHAEVVTLESIGFAHVVFSGDYQAAVPWLEQATTIARQANARRYIATDHMLMAVCRRAQGRIEESVQLIDEAYELCKQIGIHFLGASLLAGKAAVCTDSEQRARLLEEGEAMLSVGGFGMAALLFYPTAIDIAMEHEDFDEALRCAGRLERCTESEPIAFCNFVIERTRALVTLKRNGPAPAVIDQLASLRKRLRQAGIGSLLPPIDRALAAHQHTALP